MREPRHLLGVPELIRTERATAGLTQRQLAVRTLARLVEGCGFRLVLGADPVAERTGRTGAMARSLGRCRT